MSGLAMEGAAVDAGEVVSSVATKRLRYRSTGKSECNALLSLETASFKFYAKWLICSTVWSLAS